MYQGWSFICVILVAGLTKGHSTVEQSNDGSSGSIKFSTPDLNDEEQESMFMPAILKCDACHVIAYQLHGAFSVENSKRKSLKFKLPESEVMTIFEDVCSSKSWDSYGLKEVQGVKRLSGPGLETSDSPGIMAGGGKWPGRIRDMCEIYMGDVGEMEVYAGYKKKPDNLDNFRKFLCNGKGILGECSKLKKATPKREEL